jgi:hypothetical protein
MTVATDKAASTPLLPCPKCGYDLRGLAAVRCPECGTPLRIVPDRPESIVETAWRVGLAGLISGAVIGFLALLLSLGVSGEVVFFGSWITIALLAIIAWIHSGRRLLLRYHPDTFLIVVACWLAWLLIVVIGIMGLLLL